MGRIRYEFRLDRYERRLLFFCTFKITSATSATRVHVERFYSVQFRLYNLPIHSRTAQQKTSYKRNMMEKQARGPKKKIGKKLLPSGSMKKANQTCLSKHSLVWVLEDNWNLSLCISSAVYSFFVSGVLSVTVRKSNCTAHWLCSRNLCVHSVMWRWRALLHPRLSLHIEVMGRMRW